ncbi:aminoglycoside phosphotransferase family protein [Curtobacterium sp. Leaf261]|uniref:aminoglycoside phosphotransferase family protein n=1 Tax=Curtobacterium sp. Leaf261 TaxID=1736311 RepID=UPI0006F1CCB4|nr:aminoglycoside phosphotransferase family protein [Curtobacterium sp. Leaf261]KQO65275.1 hypothetical protein ASF23_01555 [Curtobacterium sp. Leaf261]
MWPTEDAWRTTIPSTIDRAVERWDLEVLDPYTGGSASHVVAVRTADGLDAVLKLSLPHREARDEGAALRWWDGNGAVRLLASDPDDPFVLLLERCAPGVRLADRAGLAADDGLTIAASLLVELWSAGDPDDAPFERLTDVADEWADLAEERMSTLAPPLDPGVVRRGVGLLRELPRSAGSTVVVHGDYNPGNVLTASRRPWLVIDPKPMTGDPAYDLCPLLMQVDDPFARRDPVRRLRERIALLSDVTAQPRERIAAWCVARLVESALWSVSRGQPRDAEDGVARAALMAGLVD